MKLGGIQKLTLLDYPGKLACTLFAPGCNFRCPFCHNASLVLDPAEALDLDEVLAFLQKRRGVLEGVCLTGGEPLLQPGVEDFLRKIKAMGYAVKLDTNGSRPRRLGDLVRAGLVDYVAMDVKNSRDRYAETVGIPGFDLAPVEESVAFLLEGTVDYEFRTTVVRELHTAESLRALSAWIAGARRYYLQGFVDSGDLIRPGLTAYTAAEMEDLRRAVLDQVPSAELRGV